jgi:EAL domain-containing protein (putative c-di-GMP-specific phosphodiesterase class I)
VETEEQRKFLSGIGANELQGFLMSHPMSGERIDEMFGISNAKPAAA